MAKFFLPKPTQFDWLSNAAVKLEKSIYRKVEFKYKKIMDNLKKELKCEKEKYENDVRELEDKVEDLNTEITMLKNEKKNMAGKMGEKGGYKIASVLGEVLPPKILINNTLRDSFKVEIIKILALRDCPVEILMETPIIRKTWPTLKKKRERSISPKLTEKKERKIESPLKKKRERNSPEKPEPHVPEILSLSHDHTAPLFDDHTNPYNQVSIHPFKKKKAKKKKEELS